MCAVGFKWLLHYQKIHAPLRRHNGPAGCCLFFSLLLRRQEKAAYSSLFKRYKSLARTRSLNYRRVLSVAMACFHLALCVCVIKREVCAGQHRQRD